MKFLAAIGAGGMGEVYRARDPRLGREVAIKILPAAYASDADRLRRFEQEARAASALNHPNILTIYDVGTADGSPYLVSELLEGQTLRQRMAGTPLSSWRAVDYARQIAHGLAATHEKGILHRDLKPENVFITKDERVKILDFGLAKLGASRAGGEDFTQAQTVPCATEPGLVLGTVGYMSPEQVRGLTTDARSDIFSFGAIVYEMIAGRRAFSRESSVETMNAILAAEPPELSSAGGGVSPELSGSSATVSRRVPRRASNRCAISRSHSGRWHLAAHQRCDRLAPNLSRAGRAQRSRLLQSSRRSSLFS